MLSLERLSGKKTRRLPFSIACAPCIVSAPGSPLCPLRLPLPLCVILVYFTGR
jgi:hypothetical protein